MVSDKKEQDRRIARFYIYRGLTSVALFIPFWQLWLSSHVASYFEFTLVDVTFWATLLFVQIPAGYFADKYSRKRVLFVGEALRNLGMLGFGLSFNLPSLTLSNSIWAVGIAFIVATQSPLLYETLMELGRSREYTAVEGKATTLMFFGNAAGSFLGAALVGWTGRLDLTLILSSVLGFAGFLSILRVPEPRIEREAGKNFAAQVREGLRVIRGSEQVRLLIVFQVILQASLYLMTLFRPLYFRALGFEPPQIGLLIGGFLVVGGVTAIWAHKIENHFKERRALNVLFLVAFLSFSAIYVARDLFKPVALLQGLLYAVWGLEGPIIYAYLNHRLDASQRSTVFSMASVAFTLTIVAVEPVFGIVMTAVPDFFLLGLLLAVVMAAPSVYVLARWTKSLEIAGPAADVLGEEEGASEDFFDSLLKALRRK